MVSIEYIHHEGALIDFAINKGYEEVERRGNKLVKIGYLIDWDAFRPIVSDLYKNNISKGDRLNIDVVIMIKRLVLQQWFGLSDLQLERDLVDRISFKVFIGISKIIPGFTTVWLLRERLAKSGKDKEIWVGLGREGELLKTASNRRFNDFSDN